MPQPRNRLEDRRGKDNEMSGGVWKIVEANVRKIRVTETERRRDKGRSRKEMRGVRKEEEAKKRENSRGKKVVKEWEIWNEEKKTTRLEEEAKKLVSEKFH